jgi:HptB-dependent secretion and biofilm anti anti-sigma factor
MAVTTTRDGDKLIIAFSGAFDFHSRSDFMNAYKDQPTNLSYILDFRKSHSVDSSALGLLMIFREHLGNNSSNITVTGCSPQLMKLFEVAQFHTIFNFK